MGGRRRPTAARGFPGTGASSPGHRASLPGYRASLPGYRVRVPRYPGIVTPASRGTVEVPRVVAVASRRISRDSGRRRPAPRVVGAPPRALSRVPGHRRPVVARGLPDTPGILPGMGESQDGARVTIPAPGRVAVAGGLVAAVPGQEGRSRPRQAERTLPLSLSREQAGRRRPPGAALGASGRVAPGPAGRLHAEQVRRAGRAGRGEVVRAGVGHRPGRHGRLPHPVRHLPERGGHPRDGAHVTHVELELADRGGALEDEVVGRMPRRRSRSSRPTRRGRPSWRSRGPSPPRACRSARGWRSRPRPRCPAPGKGCRRRRGRPSRRLRRTEGRRTP